jgi:hypothetical protein
LAGLTHKVAEAEADFTVVLLLLLATAMTGLKTGARDRDSRPNIVGQFIATCIEAVILSV